MASRNSFIYFFIVSLLLACDVSYGQDYIVSNTLNIETGLPHSDVSTIVQDNYGFIWLGTPNGLCRYDGKELLSVNEFEDDRWNILRGARVNDMLFSLDSLLYIACYGIGIVSIDLSEYGLTAYTDDIDGERLPNINKIYETQSGEIYLCSEKGLYWLNKGNIQKTGFLEPSYDMIELPDGDFVILSGKSVFRYGISDGMSSEIMDGSFSEVTGFDSDILCLGGVSGLHLLDMDTRQSRQVTDDCVTAIVKDYMDNFWVGTKKNGICLYDSSMNFIRRYDSSDRLRKYRLSNDLVNVLYADNVGNLWAGTMDGLSQIALNINDFQLYDNFSYSYLGKRIKGICEYYGHIVISTLDGDIDIWDRDFREKVSLSDYADDIFPDITVIRQTSDGSLLLGGEGGISVFSRKDLFSFLEKPFGIKSRDFGDSFLDKCHVNLIEEDIETGLWIGTNHGLFNVQPNENRSGYDFDDGDEGHVERYFKDCLITSLLVTDSVSIERKRIWVGTRTGLKYIDYSGGEIEITDYSSLSDDAYFKNSITSIIESSTGDIAMLSICEGLKIISGNEKWSDHFMPGSIKNGIMDNIYETLIEDNSGNYWIGGIGLLKWNPDNDSFRYYSTDDGIINRSFKVRSAYKLKSGEILMAGLNSIDVFIPDDVKDYTSINANAVFTHFRISGIDVTPGYRLNGREVLPQIINEVPSVSLAYDQNDFSVSFKVLDYQAKHYYKYKLKGEDDDYIYCSDMNNEAMYSNMVPGKYRLIVYYTDNNFIWKNKPITLDIVISPPFYRTTLAYVIYILLLISGICSVLRLYQERLKQKNAVLLADAIHKEEQKSNDLKLKFFADISHEIKTPLTLIYSPLSEICGLNVYEQEKVKAKLSIAMKNVERLKLLAESLIDMERQSVDYAELAISKVDVVAFCKEVASLFKDLASSRNIDYSFICAEKDLWGYFDAIKIEKVLFNLIGNAFKFTSAGGYVKVGVEDDVNNFSIYVEDSGIGISEANRKKIFERYYRVLNTEKPGNGIGLAMSETIIRNHHGILDVKSEEGRGSRFTVILKKGFGHYKDINIIDTFPAELYMGDDPMLLDSSNMDCDKQIHLLVVDDNGQMREYLKESLGMFYSVYAASNGKEALDIAAETELDMVLSDVVMPEMDGFQLCEELKSNIKTSHIPVLLISAQGQSHMKIKGYASKADAFIEKPFNMNVLLAKIRNVLEQRKELTRYLQAYAGDDVEKGDDSLVSDIDKEFMDNVVSVIENNLDNAEFGVDDLAHEIGMSRPVMYRKIKALTGMSIVEFVRHIKLHKADRLLRSGKYNVSEVMYMIGFNSMSYFSKAFKKEFGYLPKSSKTR